MKLLRSMWQGKKTDKGTKIDIDLIHQKKL